MTKRVLIVSPHFPPVNAPDMQRVRVSLPGFVAAGWEVTVLTVADPTPGAPEEAELLATIPAAVHVERVTCFSRRWTRWLGVGNVALRALPFLFLGGCRLLTTRRYDAIYFSTTMFSVLPFGRLWRQLSGVPYVIDLQDPWVSDYYDRPGAPPPPGGWKYKVNRLIASALEGWTLQGAAHIITVSPDYPAALRQRHPLLAGQHFTELPFGAPDRDFEYLRQTLAQRPAILPDGPCRVAFAGAVGPGMLACVEAVLAAAAGLRRAGLELTVHFFGTTYSGRSDGPGVTAHLARQLGLGDGVRETPGRLHYFEALQVTLEADVNLLLGSSDLGFTPSKVLPLLAAGRPILAVAHEGSALAARLAALGLPCQLLAGLAPTAAEIAAVAAELRRLLAGGGPAQPPPVPPALRASALADRQLEILAAAGLTRS